jgi:DNA-binding beta-propeller fold protein YncE
MAVAKCALGMWLSLQLLCMLRGRRVLGEEFLASGAAVLHFSCSIMRRGHVRRSLVGSCSAKGAGCVSAFGKEGNGSGEFDGPMGIAFDGLGNVAVSCVNRVQIFRYSDWAPVRSLSITFKYACAIAYDSSGHILVVNHDNHRVEMFRSSDGQHVRSIGGAMRGEGGLGSKQLLMPTGVCCDGSGKIVVHDGYSNGRLQVYRLSDGAHVRSIGSKGSGPGQFQSAGHLAFDVEGNLVVSDVARIQVLEYSSGRHLRSIRSDTWEKVSTGMCIALDSAGHIVVADEFSNRVQFLRYADGQHVRSIGSGRWGSGQCAPGEFNRPYGIAIDGDGRVLVCDMNNHRVQVLQ